MYYGKGAFTFSDSYTLPVYLRRFYLKRLEKEYMTEKEYIETVNKAKALITSLG